jgi:hypothetical protein
MKLTVVPRLIMRFEILMVVKMSVVVFWVVIPRSLVGGYHHSFKTQEITIEVKMLGTVPPLPLMSSCCGT